MPLAISLPSESVSCDPATYSRRERCTTRPTAGGCAPPPAFGGPGLPLAALPDTNGITAPHAALPSPGPS